MEKICRWIVDHQKLVLVVFVLSSLVSLFFVPQVQGQL